MYPRRRPPFLDRRGRHHGAEEVRITGRLLLDDGFVHHPKVVSLTPRDRWTWLELLSYCSRYRTGGVVPTAAASVVRGASPAFIRRAFELGLLEENTAGDGWRVHHWGIYNGSTIAERVAAFLDSAPEASANEVAKSIAGRRDVVLAEVARQRQKNGRKPRADALFGGTEETEPGTEGGSADGSGGGPYRRVQAHTFGPEHQTLEDQGRKAPGPSEGSRPSARAPLGAPRAESLEVVANCPKCGELRSVPRGFTLAGHLEHVHGLEPAEALELAELAGGV